ncbi:DE-cadherin [Lepeophtheirus salmonis]|uniref:DE-cadherin n=1 Tax=Lepeophtheirus salmonis TaxID=72036 RepID=UPI001AE51330|nr:DE-cadherin-like [Lepeophtheirus salmonis]XP_040581530.1 DE-cadherin-like [Lepeophtheirus salmonis]
MKFSLLLLILLRIGSTFGEADPSIIGGEESLSISAEQVSNRYKPKFDECENYAPEVQEEAKRGTKVIRVHATDRDGKQNPSGQVTYSIVSTDKKFKIHPESGWLVTDAIFDRDEPQKDKLVHVTVKASDNGRPQLEDVCTLAVKILDINDNFPVFDRGVYDVVVPRDTQVETQIVRISASDVDEGDNQKISYQLKAARVPSDLDYFKWDEKTGAVFLGQMLDKPISSIIELKAKALDSGSPPKSTEIDITIEVVQSNNKPPSFLQGPGAEIKVSEMYNDYSEAIATYTATSNIEDDPTVFFQLVSGRTEQTNKDGTFRAVQDQNRPHICKIYLAKQLEYESVTQYTLTLQVRNAPDLVAEAQLVINVLDKNNQAPIFVNIESGSVLEHEKIGTTVMQVSAIDHDGTYPNNRVYYRIASEEMKNKFNINPDTGVITTKVEFDREERAVYSLPIIGEDGAASALLKNGQPNSTPLSFRIVIADINDNPPYFPHSNYSADVPENQDLGSKVMEVTAKDKDTEASITTYSIKSGNIGGAFSIEEKTGFIRVASKLDYESIKIYHLVIQAWDGKYSSEGRVDIHISNENDMKPVFSKERYTANLKEEQIPTYPIFQVSAMDPDIDPGGPQNMSYYLDSNSQTASHFSVNSVTGDLNIIRKLDRDLPYGFPQWNIYVFAKDENGGPKGIESFVEMVIVLEDINDNSPFLNMPNGLVWYENQGPGIVGELLADDYDTEENGPPFTFEIDPSANQNLKAKFAVKEYKNNGTFYLETLTSFDRELQKRYDIPINICDRKKNCGVSKLFVVIGDVNDNPMEPGDSSIFVYNYEGRAPDTTIGRVYVSDPDDWDLPDKTFRFAEGSDHRGKFDLNRHNGFITMRRGIPLPEEKNHFTMKFLVEDPTHGQTNEHAVSATVNVTIQKIPEEAVIKSGSMRIVGSPESFILPDENGVSKRDLLVEKLKDWLNATYVDVFAVLPYSRYYTDIRFSAHGSPYYPPERLEGSLANRRSELEESLGIEIVMIKIDECLYEGINCNEGEGCTNYLDIDESPVTVYTNKSSFVGVGAWVKPFCSCSLPDAQKSVSKYKNPCDHNPCLNGGNCISNGLASYKCECPSSNNGQFGSNCERLAASFNGEGWSWHPSLSACGDSALSLSFNTDRDSGTLLYVGPTPGSVVENITDYLALEIEAGRLKMYLNYGSGTKTLSLGQRIDDGKTHELVMKWTNTSARMELDDNSCTSTGRSDKKNQCFIQISMRKSKNSFLNVNGPLQIGGVSFGTNGFQDLLQRLSLKSSEMPYGDGFAGCIRNLTYRAGSRTVLYDLGDPSDGDNYTPGCDAEFVQAVKALKFYHSYVIVVLVFLACICAAVIVFAIYRKKRIVFSDKDIDCDIRENIINYEDEGGGEGDQTGYDLSVLRMMADGTPSLQTVPNVGKLRPDNNSNCDLPDDINLFLTKVKDQADCDPDSTPFDDLRHYAYEGDGNSNRTLSSLHSGSSDADLEFDYLHSFGPRFKKLADMYGEEPDSDDEAPALPQAASESWC